MAMQLDVLIVFFAHNHHDISGLDVLGASFACIIRMNFSSLERRLERDGLRDTQKHHQCSCFLKERCLIVFAAAWNPESQVIPSMLSLTWQISKVFASPWAFNMFGTLILGMMLSCFIVSGWFQSIWVSGRIGEWKVVVLLAHWP